MKDRFAEFNDLELDRIWEALSAFDAGGRTKVDEEVTELFRESGRVRQVRSRKKMYPPLGNKTAQSGCDRCDCGCKYWEGDLCIDCGAEHDPAKFKDEG